MKCFVSGLSVLRSHAHPNASERRRGRRGLVRRGGANALVVSKLGRFFHDRGVVVVATTDGLGKVVHGVTGLIVGGHEESVQEEIKYHAKNLPERRKTSMSLMDRVSGVAAEEAKSVKSPMKSPQERRLTMNSSMLVPVTTAAPKRGGAASWDVNRPDYT